MMNRKRIAGCLLLMAAGFVAGQIIEHRQLARAEYGGGFSPEELREMDRQAEERAKLRSAPPPPADMDPLPPEQQVKQREEPPREAIMLAGRGGVIVFSVAGDTPTLSVTQDDRKYTVELVPLIRHLPRVMFDVEDAAIAKESKACRTCRERGTESTCLNVIRGLCRP